MGAIINSAKKIYSDTELVTELQIETNHDKKRVLQNEFYRKFKNYIFKTALNACRNFNDGEQLAKDLVQNTFIKAFEAIPKFIFPNDVNESDHKYLIKAWLGRIAINCFKKLYADRIKEVTFDDRLVAEDEQQFDLFEELYGSDPIEVPNEIRIKLQDALNMLTDRQKHILLVYANEDCIDSKLHLGTAALNELCKIYDTTPDNIRQIKKRALDKIRTICFPETN